NRTTTGENARPITNCLHEFDTNSND
ncbi:unnamed protein product, partial [Rotaria sp. Silwood2]